MTHDDKRGQVVAFPAPRSPTLLDKCRRLRDGGKLIVWPETTKGGKPTASITNVEAFLAFAEVEITYDEFERRPLIHGIPDLRELDEPALIAVRGTADFFGLKLSAEYTDQAVMFLSGQRRVHPVRRYLDGLKWDGKARLDRWLSDFVGVEDSEHLREYHRAVGSQFLIAAVRRVRQPGVKFDTMLVLEGVQGSGKSSVGRALVPDEQWFTDSLPIGVDPKITIERTAAKWIVELAELTGISRAEVETIKAFITRQTDEAREAFQRKVTRAPRQFVLLGTTNDDRYLIDGTGNRRFLPVRVLGEAGSIDLAGIRAAREQLWAEAAAREAASEPIELPRHLWAVANAEQEKRRLVHPIETRVIELVEDIDGGFIPSRELRKALGFTAGRMEIRQQKLADDAMVRLGWQRLGNALKIGPRFRERGWAKGDNYRAAIWEFDGVDGESGRLMVHSAAEIRRRARSDFDDGLDAEPANAQGDDTVEF
jgi:predicted P-loop ATPase